MALQVAPQATKTGFTLGRLEFGPFKLMARKDKLILQSLKAGAVEVFGHRLVGGKMQV